MRVRDFKLNFPDFSRRAFDVTVIDKSTFFFHGLHSYKPENRLETISPVILEGPVTNCNRNFLFINHLKIMSGSY